MCFRQILTVGAFAFKKIRDSICAETVNAKVKPEAGNSEHLILHFRIVIVQVWLAGIETVAVILFCLFVPSPVGGFCIDKDNARILILLISVAPDVVIAIWRIAV